MAKAATAESSQVYVVTYLETGASAAHEAAALVRQAATANQRETDNLFSGPLQEIGRPSRFAVVTGWRDKPAFEAHRAKPPDGPEAKLQALLVGPPDRRANSVLAAAPAAAPPPGAVFVLTHVDIVPPAKEQAKPLIEQLARDSRKENGNLFFDAFFQDSRPNHFTLFEGWRSPEAFDAHVAQARTRAFREKVLPMQGALYDERVYRTL